MGTSKHRKGHKQKVAAHKKAVQDKRAYIKSLTQQLETAILKAELPHDTNPIVMENQPTLHITGYQPLASQEIKL